MKYSYYRRSVKHLEFIDPYRLQDIYNIPDGPIFHAFKKLCALGRRGTKPMGQDVQEAIDSLERWKEMRLEDEAVLETDRPGEMCGIQVNRPVTHLMTPSVWEKDRPPCPACRTDAASPHAPDCSILKQQEAWAQGEARMDNIGRNSGDGLHYPGEEP